MNLETSEWYRLTLSSLAADFPRKLSLGIKKSAAGPQVPTPEPRRTKQELLGMVERLALVNPKLECSKPVQKRLIRGEKLNGDQRMIFAQAINTLELQRKNMSSLTSLAAKRGISGYETPLPKLQSVTVYDLSGWDQWRYLYENVHWPTSLRPHFHSALQAARTQMIKLVPILPRVHWCQHTVGGPMSASSGIASHIVTSALSFTQHMQPGVRVPEDCQYTSIRGRITLPVKFRYNKPVPLDEVSVQQFNMWNLLQRTANQVSSLVIRPRSASGLDISPYHHTRPPIGQVIIDGALDNYIDALWADQIEGRTNLPDKKVWEKRMYQQIDEEVRAGWHAHQLHTTIRSKHASESCAACGA